MNASFLIYLVIVIAGLIAAVSPLLWRPILLKTGVLDIPNHRSSHTMPTLRGGGIAQLTATAFFICMALFIEIPGFSKYVLLLALIASLVVGIVGLIEDVNGIPARWRAMSQTVVGLIYVTALWGFELKSIGWLLFLTLFFVANVNFTNFMDGVNGISGIYAIGVGIAYCVIGFLTNSDLLSYLGAFMALVFAVFLYWNFSAPGMFLGDVGSYLLGGLVGATAILALWSGVSPVTALAPLSIYWFDTVLTLFKRLFSGQPIFEAHRMHIYQQMTDRGLEHSKVSITVGVMTLLCGIFGLLSLTGTAIGIFASIVLLVFVCLVYAGLPIVIERSRRR